jgi:uncharacterized membrane protein YeiH
MSVGVVPLPLAVDVGATFLFSITGAMVAIRRQYDLVGLFAMALFTGLGGSLLRDGLFLQNGPPVALRNPYFLPAVIAGCVAAALFHRYLKRLSPVFLLADTLGLGAYAVFGCSKAYAAGLSAPACVFVGMVNAVGGGLIRDLIVGSEPLVFKPGQFYVLAAAAGAGVFAIMADALGLPLLVSAGTGMTVTVVLRYFSILFNWKTGPILRQPPLDRGVPPLTEEKETGGDDQSR